MNYFFILNSYQKKRMSLNKPIWKLRNWIDESKLDWDYLSKNPNAIKVIKKNLNKIAWIWLSENPNVIYLLEKKFNKIKWSPLSKNPNAIHLLEKNQNKIDWDYLSGNPSIFELDYEAMKENNHEIYDELIKEVC